MFPSPLANSLIVWNNPTKQVTTEVTLFYKEYWNSWIYDSWDFRQISSTCILFYLPIFSLSSYTDVTSCQYALDFFFLPEFCFIVAKEQTIRLKEVVSSSFPLHCAKISHQPWGCLAGEASLERQPDCDRLALIFMT